VRVTAGTGRTLEATVPGTPLRQLPSPDRVPRVEVYEMEWQRLPMGTLSLPEGRTRLRLEALENAGGRVMDVVALQLEGRPGS